MLPAMSIPIIGAGAAVPAFSGTLAGTNVAVGTMPEVNGESTTDETPAKAGGCGVASGWMAAVVFCGLRTLHTHQYTPHKNRGGMGTYLSITCTTPFAVITSGIRIFAEFTNNCPLSRLTVRFWPCAVVNCTGLPAAMRSMLKRTPRGRTW